MPQPTWVLLLTMSNPLWLQCSHLLMATSGRIMHHVTKLKSSLVSWTWQWVHFTQWPPQSPDLNPMEHLWDVMKREIRIMNAQPTNLQQLRDAIMSIWTKISEEFFQHLVESMPRRIKAVQNAKGGPTWYWLQVHINKLECHGKGNLFQ